MILSETRENLKEFLKELEHNQKINFKKDLKNRIDIDYVINRIKDILQY